MFQQSTITFLSDLAKNNNKIWFDENRNRYLSAKNDFENFVSLLIKEISAFDTKIKELSVKDCTFRVNRDIRFSKDKTPYKINMGASLNQGGKKSVYAGYYFHLEPGNKSFAGGGLWMPMVPELRKIRQEIDYNLNEFKNILENKKFVTTYNTIDTTGDVKLTHLPRGYEKTNAAAEYLKLKSFVVTKNIGDADLTKPSLISQSAKAFQVLTPFIKFLNKALE